MEPMQATPPPPPQGAPSTPAPVVQFVSRPSILLRAVAAVVGLMVVGVVFLAGLAFGAAIMFAGTMLETPVIGEIYRDGGRSTVAVIPIEGVIDAYRAESVRLMADHVVATPAVKAVVLRIDSPGGGIAPSDQIWYQVERLQKRGLPVVASYGGVAASGGYYVSCGADHIVAEPTCITGSIGVIAQTFVLKGLLDKVGIEPVTIMSTDSPEKDVGNPFRTWTDKDHETYLDLLDSAYSIFNDRVVSGRAGATRDAEQIDQLADGSIYTAQEALSNGLIDEIGYLDDAIARAESAAGLPKDRAKVIILRDPPSVLNELFGADARAGRLDLGSAESIRATVNELSSPRLMYLMR